MSIKPLSYDSLKTVLQHMEANLRFQLSRCIPSIRKTEKIVPLKIERLTFGSTSITVNKTKYILGIHRKYRAPIVPGHVDYTNEEGVVHHDLDEYGVPDETTNNILFPGDMAVRDRSIELNGMTNEEHIEVLEEELNSMENMLAKLMPHPVGEFREMLKQLIDDKRTELLPYYRRRNETVPLYDRFIQLRIDSPRGEQVEHVWYNAKLYKAQKSLNETLFGKRIHFVNVKLLNTCYVSIIRLPLGLKLKISELIASTSIPTTYKALQPIVKRSSYPLNFLELESDNIEDLEHHVVQTASKLVLSWQTRNIPMLHALLNVKNKEIDVKAYITQFPNEDRILLIQNWLETGRIVGTCFTFKMLDIKNGREFVELIKERFICSLFGERFAIIPMSTISELKISYEEGPNFEHEVHNWILQMEVLPVRSSTSTK